MSLNLFRRAPFSKRLLVGALCIAAAMGSVATPAFADGTLKVGVVAFPPGGADPRKIVSSMGDYTWSPIFDSLTRFTETNELQPELALSWTSPNPTTWIFKLRPNVTFSNGRPCDAEAVAANIRWLLTPEGRTSVVGRMLDAIASVRAVDPLTVEVTTSKPDALLPREMSAFYVVEPQQWDTLGPTGFSKAPIGTGPFTLDAWGATRITYTANPKSWRRANLSKLELLNMPEMTARLDALVTKGIDIAMGMGPEEKPQIEKTGGRLHARAPMDVISVTFVVGAGKPVDDLRVRQALNYAVNREAITREILHGLSQPSSQGAVHGLFGYNDDLKPYPYDPAKARALLKEAGYERGLTLETEILISQNAGDSAVYQMVAADLAAVGVTMKLIPIPTPQMVKIINEGGWRGDSFSQIFGSTPTMDPLRTLRLHSCLWPKPWYCDRTVTPKLEAALREFDDGKRAAITRDILKFYRDQATAILLYDIPVLDGVAARVKKYEPAHTRINYETISVE